MLNKPERQYSRSDSTQSSTGVLGGISGLYNKDIAHGFIVEEYKNKNGLQYFPTRYFKVEFLNAENGAIVHRVSIDKARVMEDISALELQMNELKKLLEKNEDIKSKDQGEI